MVTTHKYKLIVNWSKREAWDIDVESVNIENVTLWLQAETEDDHIINVNIQLTQRNYGTQKIGFAARGISNETK